MGNGEQLLNTLQNLMRYRGPSAFGMIFPGGQSEELVKFTVHFPLVYSLVQVMHSEEHKKWWLRHYKVQYVAEAVPGSKFPVMDDAKLKPLEKNIPQKTHKWPHLTSRSKLPFGAGVSIRRLEKV